MRRFELLAALAVPLVMFVAQGAPPTPAQATSDTPAYTSDGRMLPPKNYREWIYLSSGLDMSYIPQSRSTGTSADMAAMHIFDNVFVNPEAYRSFLQTGTWPDKTILALEQRGSEINASINKGGHSQTPELMGFEVHVKDASRGGWAFYSFDEPSPDKSSPAKNIVLSADCYSCHRDHAAVDTRFAQFYPTLLPPAKKKSTLSASYSKEVVPAK